VNYLLYVSIGPVQPFIASARRTRDLWFGSYLLSELSRTVAYTLMKHGGQLIFPAPSTEQDLAQIYSVANKIVAMIDTPQDDLPSLGQKLRTAVDSLLEQKLAAILEEQEIKKRVNVEMAYQQVKDVVELMWVALPCASPTRYRETRMWLEAILSNRKNTRDFHQVTWGETRYKSSISGELESVILDTCYPRKILAEQQSEKERKKIAEERRRKEAELYRYFKATPNERLSGVDLLKRLGSEKEGLTVISTSHIAAMPYLRRLECLTGPPRTVAKDRLWQYIDLVREIIGAETADNAQNLDLDRLHFKGEDKEVREQFEHFFLYEGEENKEKRLPLDGALFFPERLYERISENQRKKIEGAFKELDKFFRYVDDCLRSQDVWHSTARPSPYYAILKADGDGMGTVIDAQAENANGQERHWQLSRALDTFASAVKQIVTKHDGALVYAGGDDVLAFVPLHTVLACAQKLDHAFREKLKGFTDKNGRQATLSIGVAIVHHLELLSEARRLVDSAESTAKGITDKNALAILLSKRGGGAYTIAGYWGEFDVHMGQLMQYCYEQLLPTGMAYEIREAVQRLDGVEAEVLLSDIKRIIHRKLFVPQPRDPKHAKDAERYLRKHIGLAEDGTVAEPEKVKHVDKLVNELIIAQMLADAKRVAMAKVTEAASASAQEGV
jgi:CRISPR-associated protein Cmr2